MSTFESNGKTYEGFSSDPAKRHITVTLTEDQARCIANVLDLNGVDLDDKTQLAFEQRIVDKINKELAKS